MRTVLILLALVATGLAGCAESTPDDAPTNVDPDDFVLAAGKGAIAGLVVDDRFRPVMGARVLLQEEGAQTTSNANGEFSFVDLAPGRYTLRASADGHEATPKSVEVVAGQFAEANIVARRIISEGGFIISNEYAAFVPCGANVVFYGDSFDCTFDQSGDSQRVSFTIDYTAFNLSHFVMELDSNNPQYWDVWLQPPLDDSASCGETYQIMGGPDSTYWRWQLNRGESAISADTASGAGCETVPWDNDTPLQTYVYLNSLGFDQGVGFGVGVYVGVQANFVQNAFVGEPDVDVDTYCVWC